MLFDLKLIPGLAVQEGLIGAAEEAALIERIVGLDLVPFRFQGFTGKRLTTSFGWAYDFDNGRFAETDSIPDWLLPIRDRAARFAGLDASDLVQALVIRYDPGAGGSAGTATDRCSTKWSGCRSGRRRCSPSANEPQRGSAA